MPLGKAQIVDFVNRRATARGREPAPGVVPLLTILFWSLWLYLMAPLISLLLWAFGVRHFFEEMIYREGYAPLIAALRHYGLVLLGIVALLMVWIMWNVLRYGRRNRRQGDPPPVSDEELAAFYNIEADQLALLKGARHATVSFDEPYRPRLVDVVGGAARPSAPMKLLQ